MKVFYINLKKRKDRKDHMEEMLSNLNLDYHRFEAIRPSIGEIKFGKYKKFYEKSCPRFKDFVNTEVSHGRAIGVFGCYISHYMIHTSQVGIEEPYIILEDDVKITENTIKELKEIIANEKYEDWDIITSKWGSVRFVRKFEGVHIDSKFSDQHQSHEIFGGSHFVVFKNAKKIVNYMSTENVMAVDSVYNTCMLNVYHAKLDVSLMRMGTNIPKRTKYKLKKTSNTKKIKFIVCYFGQWPIWFDAFLLSCKHNPNIDWLFFTDCKIPNNYPPNIEFVKGSIKEFSELASLKLNLYINVLSVRKICDFKITYGCMFHDYLAGYDFWGMCDIYVIFGDIKNFVTDVWLDKYEIISSRKEASSGHFTLFKNNLKINNIFREIKHFEKILQIWKNYCSFDEGILSKNLKQNDDKYKIKWDKYLLSFPHEIAESRGRPPGNLTRKCGPWYWNKGKLFIHGDEIMYLHFRTWKDSIKNIDFNYNDGVESFYIKYDNLRKEQDNASLKRDKSLNIITQKASTCLLSKTSHNKKINLFMHIPKCGGKTIRQNLKVVNNFRCYNHHEFDLLPEDVVEKSFIFSFVRNPWDRIVSLYCFWKNSTYLTDKNQSDYIVKNNLDFKSFVINLMQMDSIFYQKRHPMPYIDFFFMNPSNIDFIGKFENFQEDFNVVCDKIGIPHQKLSHVNKGKHKHYTEYYDEETKQIVAELYAKDIEYFGYTFGE